MRIDLIPIEEFVRVNNLKEVRNPVLFEKGGTPSVDGLLSTEIFGINLTDRKETYAYINLNSHFLHPFIYKLIKRLNRNFVKIIHGNGSFSIDSKGEVVEDPNGDTGLDFLYNNWEKINFTRNASNIRNERLDVLKSYKKDTLFTKYFIVIPAFYRDVNLQAKSGNISHHEINDKYAKVIRLASVIDQDNNFDIVLNATKAKLQEELVEIYDLLKSKLEKKQGFIRKSLLGKNIDYGARLVISAPRFNARTYDELEVDFFRTGVPLAQCCSLFTPFVISWVKRFFQHEFEKSGMKYPVNKDGEVIYVRLKDPELYFNEEYIKKQLDKFVYSTSDRFERIEIPIHSEPGLPDKMYMSFSGRYLEKGKTETESPIMQRYATWCDIFYQAAVDITTDKHVYITRYPILDYFGTFPSKIHVLSTHKTMPMYIGDKIYNHYPVIDPNISKSDIGNSFLDTLVMSDLYLAGLGGD